MPLELGVYAYFRRADKALCCRLEGQCRVLVFDSLFILAGFIHSADGLVTHDDVRQITDDDLDDLVARTGANGHEMNMPHYDDDNVCQMLIR